MKFPRLQLSGRGAALVSALLGFAYFSAFISYGVATEDEGALLLQFSRMAWGERPYTDFHVGYTLGVYWVHGALQALFDHSILPGRWLLAAVNSSTMAGLALLVHPLAGAGGAIAAGLLYAAALPVVPGTFAAFNIPYPAWYCVAWMVWGCVALREWERSRSWAWAGACGLLAGADFAFKPNVGAFHLACAMLFLLGHLPRRGGRLVTGWWWMTWSGVVVAMLGVMGGVPGHVELTVLLGPPLVGALLVARRSGRIHPEPGAAMVMAPTMSLVVAFLAVNVPWIAYYATQMPVERFLERVLFLGAGFESFFYRPHPDVNSALLVPLSAFAVAAAAPRLASAAGFAPHRVFFAGTAVVSAGIAVFLLRAPMANGFVASVLSEYQARAFVLALVFHWAGLWTWWRAIESGDDSRISILALAAPFLYLQVYPRTDFMHWVMAAPLSVALALGLLCVLVQRWMEGAPRWASDLARRVVVLGPAIVAAALLIGNLSVVLDVTETGIARTASVTLQSDRAPIWSNLGRAERYGELSRLVGLLRRHTTEFEPILTFPSMDFVSYAAGRPSPVRDTYFFPRWLSRGDEAAIVAQLEREPTRFVVTLHEPSMFFSFAPVYYYALDRFFDENYRLFAKIGRYVVLAHRLLGPPDAAIEENVPGIRDALGEARDARYREALASGEPQVRVRALEEIADLYLESDYEPASAALYDSDESVRVAAVSAVAGSRSALTAGAMAELVAKDMLPRASRNRALEAMAVGCEASSIRDLLTILSRAYETADPDLAGLASQALGSTGSRGLVSGFWPHYRAVPPVLDDGEARELVAGWVRGADFPASLKRFAAWASSSSDVLGIDLDRLGEECAGPRELRCLPQGDPCERVDRQAYIAGVLRDGGVGLEDRAWLLLRLAESPLSADAAELAFPLLEFEDTTTPLVLLRSLDSWPEGDAALAACLRDDARPNSRKEASWLAAYVGGSETEVALVELLASADPALRMAGLWGLHRRGSAALPDAMDALRTDPSLDVREFRESLSLQGART